MYTVQGKSDRNHLLAHHAPLVKKLAHLMRAKLPPSVEVDDLIQAGMIGLLDAISHYEETHGAQFETYAVQRIRGAMLDELRSSDWMPRNMRQNMRKIEVAMTEMQQKLAEAELTGAAGGGMVSVVMNGRGEMRKIKIDPSLADPNEMEILEDLIVAACNDAKAKIEVYVQDEMGKITGGLPLPPGFKLPF